MLKRKILKFYWFSLFEDLTFKKHARSTKAFGDFQGYSSLRHQFIFGHGSEPIKELGDR